MRSKSLSLALAAALALPFVSCSKSQPEPSQAPAPQAQAAFPEPAPAEAPAGIPAQPGAAPAQQIQPETQTGIKAGAKKEARAAAKKQGKKNGKKAGAKRAKQAPAGDSTKALALRVQRDLLEKLGADGLQVTVEADKGTVVLSGAAKDQPTAERAAEVARKVAGVASVESKVQVAPSGAGGKVDQKVTESELADAKLETEVAIALVDRMDSDGFRIDTEAAGGVVTLSFPKKMKPARRTSAVEIAKKVGGVTKVVALDKG